MSSFSWVDLSGKLSMIAPGYHRQLSMSTACANISRAISHVAGDYKCTALTQFIRVLTKIPRLTVVNHSRWNGEAFSSGSSRVFTLETVFCKSSVFHTCSRNNNSRRYRLFETRGHSCAISVPTPSRPRLPASFTETTSAFVLKLVIIYFLFIKYIFHKPKAKS